MNLNRFYTIIGLAFFMVACTSQQISQTLGTVLGEGLTTEQVAAGLKEALSNGVTKARNLRPKQMAILKILG